MTDLRTAAQRLLNAIGFNKYKSGVPRGFVRAGVLAWEAYKEAREQAREQAQEKPI